MDCTLAHMKENGIKINRENYLIFAYMADAPGLDAEGKSMLPPQIQKRLKARKAYIRN
jgi:hypothetical protein